MTETILVAKRVQAALIGKPKEKPNRREKFFLTKKRRKQTSYLVEIEKPGE